MTENKRLVIPVITTIHQVPVTRVESLEVGCCQELEEEYGKIFILTADGGLAPASLRIERVKLGKTVYDQPRIGWKRCPFCGTAFHLDSQTVVKTQGD